MPPAFLFYFYCSLKNRTRFRLMRLRQPKYLISLLAGLIYIYAFFVRPIITRSQPRIHSQAAGSANPELLLTMEIGFSILVLWLVLQPWLFSYRGGGITFSEAEVQFLFAAPISRRTLLHFRILKGQIGIFIGVLISTLLFGRGSLFPHPEYLVIGLWIAYSFLALYRMGTSLAQTSLAEHGISGLKRQVWVLVLVGITVASVIAWLKWVIPAPPALTELTPTGIINWISKAASSGVAYHLLLPFRAIVRPALAQDPGSFLFRLLPALSILGISYLWVIRSDASFEEAALERAQEAARRLELRGAGSRADSMATPGRSRRAPFRLDSSGYPFVAILWKNLISAGRFGPRRLIPLLVFVAVIALVSSLTLKESGRITLAIIIGSTALGISGFMTILGPVIQRDDLRTDLLHLDLIKTFPLPGWMVVLGEILAPAAILAVLQWVLLLIAAFCLPDMGPFFSKPYHRVVYSLGAAILLPGFSLMGVLIQNAAVLLVPGWMRLGKEQQQGIEAMGQRMITMFATVVLLVFAVMPGAVLFAAAFFAGEWLLGLAVIPLAALVAVAGLLFEAALVIVWLGRLFDQFDVSLELRES